MMPLSSMDLFAGCGGLALGLHRAGFNPQLLMDNNKDCIATLNRNFPPEAVTIVQADIRRQAFGGLFVGIDLVVGGIPCQPFSVAGKRKGLEDDRGNLFYVFLRAIKGINPKAFLIENVKGLKSQDGGNTLAIMLEALNGIGYTIYGPQVLNAVNYGVPQKRERLFIIGVRNDIKKEFLFPKPIPGIFTVHDAIRSAYLVTWPNADRCDLGQLYSPKKAAVLALVPPGGCWRDLPDDIAKEYMGKSYYQTGGRTGIARRLSWDEPCLTLTCSPAQKQTERCHPSKTRPLSLREYARIQTFPDSYKFEGSISSIYKQIGNAVPVNLAYALGLSLKEVLN